MHWPGESDGSGHRGHPVAARRFTASHSKDGLNGALLDGNSNSSHVERLAARDCGTELVHGHVHVAAF